jgi:DNA-binding MarR family transcriptional regulator
MASRPVPPEHPDDLDSQDGYLLGGLGMAPSHERVYRALLRNGSADVSGLAQLTNLSPGALRRVVAVLEDEGLVTRLTGRRPRFVATSPHVAIGAIAARREEELARARQSVEVLASETRHRSGSPPEELIEVVTGQSAVGRSFMQLNLTARHDVRAFVRPPFAADVSQPPVTQDTALRCGVHARSVYDVSAFEIPGLLEAARKLVRAGEQARVATVPIKLVIVDSKIAMLPLTSDDQHAAHSAVASTSRPCSCTWASSHSCVAPAASDVGAAAGPAPTMFRQNRVASALLTSAATPCTLGRLREVRAPGGSARLARPAAPHSTLRVGAAAETRQPR